MTEIERNTPRTPDVTALQEQLGLVELVNRVLDKGVVISGDVVISIAGIDLVYLGLDVMLTSVETARRRTQSQQQRLKDG